jgi:O-antigen/teichoic acid export membrane protein
LVYANEEMWWSLFLVTLPKDIAIGVGAFLLVPTMGAKGLAWAYVIGWLLALLSVFSHVWHSPKRVFPQISCAKYR